MDLKKPVTLILLLLYLTFVFTGCIQDNSVSEGGEPSKWDRRPMVMVNGEIYLDTGKESDINGRCGVMDGEITSTVDGSEIPVEDNQSNFGQGYEYQFVDENSIDIFMNEKWIRFEKERNTWGIQLTADKVTPTGLTLVCSQSGGNSAGKLNTGSYYILEFLEDNQWKAVEILPQKHDVAWTQEAWVIPMDDSREWEVDWEWLYGQLPPGNYRIGKEIMNFRGTGDYDTRFCYAFFAIEQTI
jgi:hypothetical protein